MTLATTPTAVFDEVPALLEQMLPDCVTRQQIEALGAHLLRLEASTGVMDLSTMHHHADGVYGRSFVLRAGTVLIGLPHRRSGLTVTVGDITVWAEDGGRQRVTGINLQASTPGQMRVGFVHRDTTCITFHANDTGSLDAEVIEEALVEHPSMLITRRGQA